MLLARRVTMLPGEQHPAHPDLEPPGRATIPGGTAHLEDTEAVVPRTRGAAWTSGPPAPAGPCGLPAPPAPAAPFGPRGRPGPGRRSDPADVQSFTDPA
ncbi:hypothetical protein AB0J44_38715, partial [Streptomyces canus]